MVNWENILKDDDIAEDVNEIIDILMKAAKLTKKHMTFRPPFYNAHDLISKAIKLVQDFD